MYRGRRLIERLESIDLVGLEDVIKIQNDNFNYKAFESLPIIIDKIDTNNLKSNEIDYFKSISNWDYFSDPNDTVTPIFNVWWNKLRNKLWDEFDTMKYSYRKPNSFITYKIIREYENFDYYDILKTQEEESINDIINQSFKETIDSLENWKKEEDKSLILWKNFKNTRVNHLLGIKSFSLDNIDIGGDRNILNAASRGHGPSWRMIVKLDREKETEAWGVYPGGQSGNPGSPNYVEGISDWGKGIYKKLLFSKEPLKENSKIIFEKIINK